MKKALLALLGVCLVASVIVSVGSALTRPGLPVQPVPPGRTGMAHVYMNDNTAGVNRVAGYDRRPDGTLTPIPGSPFSTGGAGAGHALASQGSLQLSSDRRFLLAVDAGSGQISTLRIMPDGSLEIADVVSSGGGNRSASPSTRGSSSLRMPIRLPRITRASD